MHAKQYIDTVMTNIQKQLENEHIFPTKFGESYPPSIYPFHIMFHSIILSIHSTLLSNHPIILFIHPTLLSNHPIILFIHPIILSVILSIYLFIVPHLGLEFPYDFVQIVRKIFRQYFIIFAHIYFHHFLEFKRLQLHDGLNTLFLHFTYFVTEFSLIDPKELSILEDLVERLRLNELALAQRPRSDDYTESYLVPTSKP